MATSKVRSKKVVSTGGTAKATTTAPTTGKKIRKAVTPNVALATAAAAGSGASTEGSVTPPAASPLPIVPAATIASWMTFVSGLQAALPDLPQVSPVAKKRLLRMRKGGAAIAPVVIKVANDCGVVLPQVPTGRVDSEAAAITALGNLLTQLANVTTVIANYQSALQASMWGTTTSLYVVLRRLAKSDQAIESALAPVTQFFTYRNPVVRANHPKTAKGKAAKQAKAAPPSTASPTPATNAAATAPPLHS